MEEYVELRYLADVAGDTPPLYLSRSAPMSPYNLSSETAAFNGLDPESLCYLLNCCISQHSLPTSETWSNQLLATPQYPERPSYIIGVHPSPSFCLPAKFEVLHPSQLATICR